MILLWQLVQSFECVHLLFTIFPIFWLYYLFNMLQISLDRFVDLALLKLQIYFRTFSLWYFHPLQMELDLECVSEGCSKTILLMPEIGPSTTCFVCRRTSFLKKGAQRYERCPSVVPSEGFLEFLCLSLPFAANLCLHNHWWLTCRKNRLERRWHHWTLADLSRNPF